MKDELDGRNPVEFHKAPYDRYLVVKETPVRGCKYWSEHDMLRKVETYAKVYFEGKYKGTYTTTTSAQRLVFDIFGIPYTFKGKERAPETDGQ